MSWLTRLALAAPSQGDDFHGVLLTVKKEGIERSDIVVYKKLFKLHIEVCAMHRPSTPLSRGKSRVPFMVNASKVVQTRMTARMHQLTTDY